MSDYSDAINFPNVCDGCGVRTPYTTCNNCVVKKREPRCAVPECGRVPLDGVVLCARHWIRVGPAHNLILAQGPTAEQITSAVRHCISIDRKKGKVGYGR